MISDFTGCEEYLIDLIRFSLKRGIINQLLRQYVYLMTYADARKDEGATTRCRHAAKPPHSSDLTFEQSFDGGKTWQHWFNGSLIYVSAEGKANHPIDPTSVVRTTKGEDWIIQTDFGELA